MLWTSAWDWHVYFAILYLLFMLIHLQLVAHSILQPTVAQTLNVQLALCLLC